MGEFSKKVGEHGEEIAGQLMDMIGWNNRQEGIDLECTNEDHPNKKEHGLDASFHYRSTLTDKMLEMCCVSVKFSDSGYPDHPKSKFKEHISDLSNVIQCFEKSENSRKIKSKASGVIASNYSGVLIWLHQGDENKDELIEDVKDVRLPTSEDFQRAIYVIDNSRAKFIYDSHTYFKNKYRGSERVEYLYNKTGSNNSDGDRVSSGKILPVEMVCSDIIVFKVSYGDGRVKLVFVINSEFSEGALRRIVGLAHDVSLNISSDIEILFSKYNKVRNDNQVNIVKADIPDYDFSQKVVVGTYVDSLI